MEKSTKALDSYDRRILAALAESGRLTWRELAERVGLSETPVVRRVKSLEEEGYIVGYSARIDEAAMGRPISIFISVSLDRQDRDELATFEFAIANAPQIMSCFMMAGDTDYLMRVAVQDIEEFHRFLDNVLRPIPGMRRVNSNLVLKKIVRQASLAMFE